VEGSLEIEGLLALVLHKHLSGEFVVLKRHRERAQKLLIPHLLRVVAGGHFELHRRIGHGFHSPVHVSGESMLLDLSGAELRPAVRKSTTDGLGSIHLGIGPHSDIFLTSCDVRSDHSSEEVDVRSVAFGIGQTDVFEPVIVRHESGRDI